MPKSPFDACEIAEQIGRWQSYATAIDRKGVSTVRRMPAVRPERARMGSETEKNSQSIAEQSGVEWPNGGEPTRERRGVETPRRLTAALGANAEKKREEKN